MARWINLWWTGLYAIVMKDVAYAKLLVVELVMSIPSTCATTQTLFTSGVADWINSDSVVTWALVSVY